MPDQAELEASPDESLGPPPPDSHRRSLGEMADADDGSDLRSSVWERPPLSFALSGHVSIHSLGERSQIRSASGLVLGTRPCAVELDVDGGTAELLHNLPDSVRLERLAGQRVRITLVDGTTPSGKTQTVTIRDEARGRVLLIARFGPVHGVAHLFGDIEIRAVLSQRQGGPLIIGTAQVQRLVAAGSSVALAGMAKDLVVEHVARCSHEVAAYLIADRALYA